ncbi:MAG TPA: STAS domain-containing protein [Jatrophihabitantaceae bacterium]|jgi:anti-anti-sigma factor|nr:STAS domain-containing protein [Jatrophihabitantaceae bacterium]
MSASRPGCAVLRLCGEIDAATLIGFRGEADELLLDDTVGELIVDLSETTVLDHSGIELLVHLKMLACDNAIGLVLRAVPPPVRSLLARAGLDRVLDIRET